MKVVVIGAGITGLAAAVDLIDGGASVVLVDAAPRAGGKITTEQADGFVIEHGPDSFVAYRPAAAALAQRFGLSEDIIAVSEPRVVFLRRNGKMVRMPDGMGLVLPTRLGPFIRTRLFTWPQKLRAGLDIVLPRYLKQEDMAIGKFLRHRLGPAVIERLADPLIGGIYGTSIEELSVDSVLPMLRDYEESSRSLIIASLLSGRKARKDGSPFRTLRGGLGDLIEALVAHLRASDAFEERFGDAAESLTRIADGTSRLRLVSGEEITADAVVLATPAPVTAMLIDGDCPEAAAALRTIPHASTAVVSLAYRAEAFPSPPAGHGYLDAGTGKEDRSPSSGCTVTSAKWAGRAPDGTVLIRSFLPERSRDLFSGPDDDVLAAVERDVAETYGVEDEPILRRVARWDNLMPKYTVGHQERLAQIEAALAERPTWHLAGASYRGVGLPDCVTSGQAAAATALANVQG
ncbi:protoporphyrinogen oxidase [Demequina sp. TTPB684]|uniref:protoporphyrinogen oxidase n=1 Tax=unclassified Demequina TaxID=2620311 RepID=UPI001CF22C2E|nr:protoporphyrinogen oxidase [Demequina sp. TMPB413]MCB2411597.1 protoporphyrinogen oxidase [Demequina sp. TTPB684]UPU89062.1 protoporphyrinogen oxidase [Demequina sp. TMPB413]